MDFFLVHNVRAVLFCLSVNVCRFSENHSHQYARSVYEGILEDKVRRIQQFTLVQSVIYLTLNVDVLRGTAWQREIIVVCSRGLLLLSLYLFGLECVLSNLCPCCWNFARSEIMHVKPKHSSELGVEVAHMFRHNPLLHTDVRTIVGLVMWGFVFMTFDTKVAWINDWDQVPAGRRMYWDDFSEWLWSECRIERCGKGDHPSRVRWSISGVSSANVWEHQANCDSNIYCAHWSLLWITHKILLAVRCVCQLFTLKRSCWK